MDVLRYGAIRLFVERARAAAPHFAPDAPVVAAIAGVCRRLDGIPLAIELAAARAATLGIEGVAARLGDRFRLLAGGHRTAMPRHQTLRATLDWSHELLTETERVVLRRLAIFVGGFTLQAARAVAADDEVGPPDVVDCVTNLVEKSLVTADPGGATVRYRLLETTRAYALEKLAQAGEFDAAARRQARHYLDVFEGAETEAETRPTDDWLADYVPRIDNVLRSAGIGLSRSTAIRRWASPSRSHRCHCGFSCLWRSVAAREQALAGFGPHWPSATFPKCSSIAALGASSCRRSQYPNG